MSETAAGMKNMFFSIDFM